MFGDFNPPVDLEKMNKIIDRAEALTRSDMEAAADLPHGSDQQRDAIIMLIMSLGFGIAAVARTFFDQTDPLNFGAHCGTYIGQTIAKLKEAEEDVDTRSTATRPAAKSAWDA